MTDVVRVTIRFKAGESKWFRMYSGAFVRGFVYWVLKKADRTFAERLHSYKGISPFSVTPVMSGNNVVNRIDEDQEYEFLINFFVPEIGEALRDYLKMTGSLYFAGCENKLVSVQVRYVDRKSFEDGEIRKFRVDFLSPCYFRTPSSSYRFVPMPVPELMFRSLARLYSAFISEIRDEYREWLDVGGITVSGLDIRTEKILLKKGLWSVGFTGHVNFVLPEDTYKKKFAEITSTLLNFGEYSNAGGGRTSGLGVIRISNKEVVG